MPRVPEYQQQVRETTAPVPFQRDRQGIETFGGGRAIEGTIQASNDLLKTATDIFVKERERADEVAILDADLALSQKQFQREQQASTMLGRDAINAADTILPEWEADVIEVRNTLSNDRQRAEFSRKAFLRNQQLNQYVSKHVNGQLTKYDRDQTDAYVANMQRDAAVNAYSPERIAASIVRIADSYTQYGKRTGEAPELTKKKIMDATQSTHLGVIDRLIADSNYDLAESYVKATNQFLTGDQIKEANSLIASGRKKQDDQNKNNKDDMDKDLFVRSLPGAQNPLTLRELNTMAANGTIDRTLYDRYVNRLVKVNNDPTIPRTEKTAKLLELSNLFVELNGAGWGGPEVDEDTLLPISETKDNRLEDIQNFRRLVSEAAPYLTAKQEEAFYLYTERDYNEALAGKTGIFKSFVNYVSNLNIPNPGTYITQFFANAMPSSVTVEAAEKEADKIRESAVRAANPQRSQYKEGDILTNPNGIKGKVVGFDKLGKPIIEVVK